MSTSTRYNKLLRQTISLAVLLILMLLAWETLKWIGGDIWRPESNPFGIYHEPPLDFKIASDLNLPHLWDIGAAFVKPARRNGPPLITILLPAAMFTFREALVGFSIGVVLGLTLGEGHMSWQMNEINALIWPSPLGIGLMDPDLYQQTVDISVDFGVLENPPDDAALRTDLAQAALDSLGNEDTTGEGFEKQVIEVTPGGE